MRESFFVQGAFLYVANSSLVQKGAGGPGLNALVLLRTAISLERFIMTIFKKKHLETNEENSAICVVDLGGGWRRRPPQENGHVSVSSLGFQPFLISSLPLAALLVP